jgi:flagellar biosynthesis protein FlhG
MESRTTVQPVIVSVGGGKGGVGKSTVASNIGSVLASQGHSVGFVDADLGGANLHQYLGVRRPTVGLQHYLMGRLGSIEEARGPTEVPGTWLVSGASDVPELANAGFLRKRKIIRSIAGLNAEYIFVDLGAGTSNHVADFYAAFPYAIIVTDGLPASIENAYGYLKNGIVRGLTRLFPGRKNIQNLIMRLGAAADNGHRRFASTDDMLQEACREYPAEARQIKEWLRTRRTFLVMNMVRSREDIQRGKNLDVIAAKYLGVRVTYIGYIAASPDVVGSLRRARPVVCDNPSSQASGCFTAVAANFRTLTQG